MGGLLFGGGVLFETPVIPLNSILCYSIQFHSYPHLKWIRNEKELNDGRLEIEKKCNEPCVTA